MARWVTVAAVCVVLAGNWCAVEAGEGADGWQALFDGSNLDAWTFKPGGWHIDDEGALAWKKGAGYIWTKERFGDFVLDLEFKVSKGCNSGIFFRTASLRKIVQTGIEIQVLDSFGRKTVGRHDCGAIYDCLAPSTNAVKKAGEWNRLVLTCKANQITIVLNGEAIIDMDIDQWTEPRKNPDGSKNKFRTAYKDMPREGHIGLQDHGKPVWFRKVRIKPLGAAGAATKE